MSKELVAHNKPVFDQLHPRIYGAAVGLIAWFALMAWVLFDHGGGQVSLALTFMTVLFVVAVTLPWTLSLVWRKSRLPSERHPERGLPAVHGLRVSGRGRAAQPSAPRE